MDDPDFLRAQASLMSPRPLIRVESCLDPMPKGSFLCLTPMGVSFLMRVVGTLPRRGILQFRSLCCSGRLAVSHKEKGRPTFCCTSCKRTVPLGVRPAFLIREDEIEEDRAALEERLTDLLSPPYPVLLASLIADRLTDEIFELLKQSGSAGETVRAWNGEG